MSVTAQINVTPDGFCDAESVVADDDFSGFAADLIQRHDRLVLGRKTYELFVAHWPAAAHDHNLSPAEQRLGRAIDGTPRVLVSRSMTQSDWSGTEIVAELDRDVAADLAQGDRLLILGSPSIIGQFAQWGLLDALHLTVHPVMGGGTQRLFDGESPARMAVAGRSALPSGVTDFRFERA